MKSHKFLSLFIVFIATVLAIAVVALEVESTIIRALLLLPLVFITPGYAFIRAFLSEHFGAAQRALLVLGISITVAIIDGFLLHLSPWGLQPLPWAVSLGVVSITLTTIAIFRHSAAAPVETRRFARARLLQWLMISLSLLIGLGALGLARAGATRWPVERYTQMWIVPVAVPEDRVVRIGIQNMEHAQVDYLLTVQADGQLIKEWPRVTLRPNELWEQELSFSCASSCPARIDGLLYRLDQSPAPYRYVILHSDQWEGKN